MRQRDIIRVRMHKAQCAHERKIEVEVLPEPTPEPKQRRGMSSTDYAIFKYGPLHDGQHKQACTGGKCLGCKHARKPIGAGEHKGRQSKKKDRLKSELRYFDEYGVEKFYRGAVNRGDFIQYGERTKTGQLINKSRSKDSNGGGQVMSGYVNDPYDDALRMTGRRNLNRMIYNETISVDHRQDPPEVVKKKKR